MSYLTEFILTAMCSFSTEAHDQYQEFKGDCLMEMLDHKFKAGEKLEEFYVILEL